MDQGYEGDYRLWSGIYKITVRCIVWDTTSKNVILIRKM